MTRFNLPSPMSAPDATLRPSDLPDFERPPVVEVALSVQFEPLPLTARHIAELWQACRSEFPNWQDQHPIAPAFERFGDRVPDTNAWLNVSQLRRAIFRNALGTELKQYQADRFVRNWTKAPDAPAYPRYESVLSPFVTDFRALIELAEAESLGGLATNQCEVTYVNLIPLGIDPAMTVGSVVSPWSDAFSDSFLQVPESSEVGSHFLIRGGEQSQPVGRLHIVGRVVTVLESGSRALQLTLTARGQPLSANVEGVVAFMNLGREYIVKGFASFTRAEMHKAWGRRDGRN